MPERIAVVGAGYVGLVVGTCFAEMGHAVVCVDRDRKKIECLLKGHVPIHEPGLQEMAARNHSAGRLAFTTDLAEAVRACRFVFIAVGTPSLADGSADISQVKAAVMETARNMAEEKIIVIKSTVPVGTARLAERWIEEHLPAPVPFAVVSNPEFLREGSAVDDTFHMERLIVGADDERAGQHVRNLYEQLQAPVLITDRESAEMIKYASNAFLAAKISFINEMANVCEKVGADVTVVAKGMGLDRRIGPHFLRAGIGYGGTCFPKDTRAQLKIAEDANYDFKMLRAVIEVNELQRVKFAKKIERALDGRLAGARVAVMGLTFKPNTDDLRESPSVDIVRLLLDKGAEVRGYDPLAARKAANLLPRMRAYDDPYAAVHEADAMVIATEWETVKRLDLPRVRELMAQPVVVDGRNVFAPEAMKRLGFVYFSVGRPDRR